MLGKIENRRRGGADDEMVGWHHQLFGHEPGQTLGEIMKGRETCHAAFLEVTKS